MKKNTIPVFFTVDDSYAPWLDVAIRSMIVNASRDFRYRIIVLYQELSEENRRKIQSAQQEAFQIEFIRMKQELDSITDRVENRLRCDYFTMTIYFRLFIADMFPEYEKGIYIDSDIVVPGDISQMYQKDLKDNIIGACRDLSIMEIPELVNYIEYAVGVDKTEYINSGVLLMNLKKMRELRFSRHFLYLLNTYHFDTVAPDQDYINAICNGKILYMEENWDAMPPERGSRATLAKPDLIHYNLFLKPWCYDEIPYEEYFWHYAKQSPFYREIIEFKANYSEQQKRSDEECLAHLIEKAGKLAQQEVTFRKIRKKGESICI